MPGLPKASGILRLAHPEAGELRLAYETLELSADDDQRLTVHLPAATYYTPRHDFQGISDDAEFVRIMARIPGFTLVGA